MLISARKWLAATVIMLMTVSACSNLPDVDVVIARHSRQAAAFENARGAVSKKKSAAIMAELKRDAGDIDILDRQIAIEQAVVNGPLILGNKTTLLQDGAATYAAMFAAIRNARDHINLETYIFEDDEIGQKFADLLLEQQARGVQVNLIYDSIGTIATPRAFFERFKENAIAVLEFNPVNPLLAKKRWLINNRDHRKLLVVDGRIAFLGGVNISSTYSSPGRQTRKKQGADAIAWRDTHLQIEGPVASELQKLFMDTWGRQHGPPLMPRNYFPTLRAQGQDIVRAIGSTPDDPYSRIYLTLIAAIDNATRQVYLTNAYFVPDPRLVQALTDAARRGVDVHLILPSQSDSDSTLHAGRSHYSNLLQAGIKIHERRGALLHAKTALIDGVWSCVGSSNLDWRSFLDNDEVNAIVLGTDFAKQMRAMFDKDLAASETIDLESWERRPLLPRIKEWLARLIERLL